MITPTASLTDLLAALNRDGLRLVHEFAAMLATHSDYQRRGSLRMVKAIDAHAADIDKSKGAYFVSSTGGAVTFASPALVRWLGTTGGRLKEEGWLRFIDGDDERKRVGAYWLGAAQTGIPFSYTVRCRTTSGAIAYAFVKVHPRHHPVTKLITGFYGAVHPQAVPSSAHLSLAQA